MAFHRQPSSDEPVQHVYEHQSRRHGDLLQGFRGEIIRGIRIEENRFGFEPEITSKIARLGFRIFEIGITYSGRTYAEGKKINWRDGVRALWCILKYR